MKRVHLVSLLAALSALLLIATTRSAQAQTESVLYNFTGGSDGSYPNTNLTPDGAGNYYGTTRFGGLGYGTVFELSPNGNGGWSETTLYAFTSGVSISPTPATSRLVVDGLGNIYGVYSENDGSGYPNTILFELSAIGGSWVETTAFTFGESVGELGGLVIDAAGNIYGTDGAKYIDNSIPEKFSGSIFELSPTPGGWTEQVLYTGSKVTNGITSAGPTIDVAGNIYAIVASEVVKLSPNGNGWTSTMIYHIGGPILEASTPIVDKAGNIYGTLASVRNLPCSKGGCGKVYKLVPGQLKWTYKIIHTFGPTPDGNTPEGNLALDAAGNVYGTASSLDYPEYGYGNVYELKPSKPSYLEQILWSFNGTNGEYPGGGVVMDSLGNLYGTALGGSNNAGVVFELTP